MLIAVAMLCCQHRAVWPDLLSLCPGGRSEQRELLQHDMEIFYLVCVVWMIGLGKQKISRLASKLGMFCCSSVKLPQRAKIGWVFFPPWKYHGKNCVVVHCCGDLSGSKICLSFVAVDT